VSILTAHNLAQSYGPDDIFDGVSVDVPHRARIALVGPNGAGKTTLLRLLIGLDIPAEGTVTRMRGLRIGFLPQRPELDAGHSLYDELLGAFDSLRAREAELRAIEHAIAGTSGAEHDALIARYGELLENFERDGGYSYENRIRMVLQGLGFTPDDYDRPITQLSGGQKTRALLGRLLLEAPDLLALDEPTNHLDITAVEWLEGFLKDFPGAVLLVSHDRYFMDAVAKTVWELDFGTLEVYRGSYSHYVQQRQERHERLLREYEAQQEFIAKEVDYIRRNIAGQNTRQAKGRLKRLERLRRDELIFKPRTREAMHLKMADIARSGDLVLRTRSVRVGYEGDAPLFDAPDITLRRGEVAALIGPNGAGKSTFIKTVIGELPPLAGEVVLGANVKIGYFAQAHESLDPKRAIIDEIQSVKPMGIAEARNFLGGYLFQGDDVFRPIETLSGGERGRVALAKLALTGANFLLLDEPTNHLDIASQEILEHVLREFAGTILLVSHDRYLINALATQIWTLAPGRLEIFAGDYQEFLFAREAERQRAIEREAIEKSAAKAAQKAAAPRRNGLSARELEQRIGEIETQISALEARLAALSEAISEASAAGDTERVTQLGLEYTQAQADLESALSDWESLVE
jgi:ATP-binding cassette subfamily F protein 3